MEQIIAKRSASKIQINGFQPLMQEIQNSKYILKLAANWDEEGALPVAPLIYETAIRFL